MNVSICMASYNGAKYIKRQIDSILIQLQEDDELIISDDSSSDNTVDIIESFKDSRIKVFKGNTFFNPTYNFEYALYKASNDYIFLADQDDYWQPNKVQVIKNLLLTYDLVLSDCTVVNEQGIIIHESLFEYLNVKTGFIYNLYKNSYSGCCMAFNRKILEKALPIPNKIPMHDWWIGLIAEIYGKVYFCNQKLIYYVRHSNNASQSGLKSSKTLREKILMRINLAKNIFNRISTNK